MLGKCAFVECPCEDEEDIAVAACSSCKKPEHHMCSNNIHEGELNTSPSATSSSSGDLPVAVNSERNSTGVSTKTRSEVGVESEHTTRIATPVQLSPRRVSLDADTPSQVRVAPGRYNRTSPYRRRSPRLDQLRETFTSHDPLIKFSVDVRLKKTVNQRLSSSGRMGTHRVQCDTWDELKIRLWGIIQHELKPLAVLTGSPPV
ncbi:hypothetical protein P3T76_014854 [Phytophthora citrophthora]|uniref:Uncharacterized protein n=1 Tax=Phytophthora citrophthora TaxID=4793 RepID=A0AAD9G199_9STRA|nr:hypothetical protein P3T76_014854 [Phytophthora citrophthora]